MRPRSALPFVGAFVVVAGALGLWLASTPGGLVRDQLRQWQFWALELNFIAVVVFGWLSRAQAWRALGIARRDLLFPIGAATLAFFLTSLVAPLTNRIYYDEQIYQGIGQNLTDLRLAQMCNDGNVEYGSLRCWRGEHNKEPNAYPYILSVAYRLVGVRDGVAQSINVAAAALLVLVVFGVTVLLTRDVPAARYASLIAALMPEGLRWSHTAAAEPTAALACAGAVAIALVFARAPSTAALFWTVAATAFAVQFRPECVLVVPVVVAAIACFAPRELVQVRMGWAAVAGLVLVSPHLAHLAAVRDEAWGAAGARFSFAYFVPNLQANGWFFLADGRFPVIYSLLALSALALVRHVRALAIPAGHFLLFWGIFLFFYAGSYNYGADVRFSLQTYAPIAMLAGMGAARLAALVAGARSEMFRHAVVTMALGAQFLWYMPFVRSTGEEAWASRADVRFARGFVAELPPNSMVLTHNPSMFHLWGQSAAQASIAVVEPDFVSRALTPRYAGGTFFHWNFWCNVADPVQQRFCATLLDRFPHTLVREYRERDYRYAIYRLDVETGTPPAP